MVEDLPPHLRPGPDRPVWAADVEKPLDSRLPALERVVFHEKLGSLGDKTVRLQQLAGWLCRHVPGADHDTSAKAALLAKADLRTGMVGEFPELQGVMGGYYARAQEESDAVAGAIAEHYAPKGPDDRCPTAAVSVVVALADKLDTLAGFFAAGIRPTGSGDPFGLRRAALGVIRLVLENGLRLPLRDVVRQALAGSGYDVRFGPAEREAAEGDLLAFFADRLRVHLRGQGVRHDLVTAVFATGREDDLVRLLARVEALTAFVGSEDGRNLLTAYRRASNIVAIEEKRDAASHALEPSADLLVEPAEIDLHRTLGEAQEAITVALGGEDFGTAMAALAGLRGPVDRFFDAVMVNAPEPERRANRLRLLSLIRSALGSVAEFGAHRGHRLKAGTGFAGNRFVCCFYSSRCGEDRPMTTWVYRFGGGKAEGNGQMKDVLGGKGAGLAEMSSLGLPVPPGFTISTEVCTYFYKNAKSYPDDLEDAVAAAMQAVEAELGSGFGDPQNPLLVSVRSGAPVSMPGMMDTVLNLGLNDETVLGLAKRAEDRRFAYDSYRRFIQMYGDVVLGIKHRLFDEALEELKDEAGVRFDTELDGQALERLVDAYKAVVVKGTGQDFPQDPKAQLWGAIGAVFGSWETPRAVTYRRLHDIDHAMGTAVSVQAMVFGNMGDDCATGVAFTRNPSTGEHSVYGEYLINAQGEDVVAGIRTPQPLTRAMADADATPLETALPQTYAELVKVFDRLETHYRDMQDIEFTVQQGRLFILQTRAGKRTAPAALKVAVDMAGDGLISREEAVARVDPASLDQLLHPTLDPDAERTVLTRGLPASPGAASGVVVFSSDEAEARAKNGEAVILVRVETSPDDIHGMHAARGIVTSRGGMTSHAAVVARGMGKACVCGAGDLAISDGERTISAHGVSVREGEVITIDGSDGTVMVGAVPTIDPQLSGDFATLMEWADAVRRLKVRTNAETPLDARTALKFGAEGIGLCRTEHMFFDPERIVAMQEMIVAEDADGRRRALDKLLPMQRSDFAGLFEIMAGLPITIRLLDPPLHEFLPHEEKDVAAVAKAAGVDQKLVRRRMAELKETNPMLGLRGCRLGILFPEIYEMQARAIFEAALEIAERGGQTVIPEVMVPLVGSARELQILKERIDAVAAEVVAAKGGQLDYTVGTMIELPRAALQAAEIARHADFFSFGTNDLTQMTLGLSRDDSGRFLDAYLKADIFAADPFSSLDRPGVGELVRLAAERGRATRPEIKLGICGEHGGDPRSVAFCEEVGLDYVSCSPYRVPIARLAAAQAALSQARREEGPHRPDAAA